MPRSCAVPGCKSSKGSRENRSFFGVPEEDEKRRQWEENLGLQLSSKQLICSLHFEESDIIQERTFCDSQGNVLAVAQYLKPKLTSTAIPHRTGSITPTSSKRFSPDDLITTDNKKIKLNTSVNKDDFTTAISTVLPKSWTRVPLSESECLVFANFQYKSKMNDSSVTPFKEVTLFRSGDIKYVCLGKKLENVFPTTLKEAKTLESVITDFDNATVCQGIVGTARRCCSYQDIQGSWRHKKCPMLINSGEKSCFFCKNARERVSRLMNFKVNEKYNKLANKYRKMRHDRLKKARFIRTLIANYERKITNSKCDLERLNLPQQQQEVVTQIIKAAKCRSTKGRRYSENWLLMCMLHHIRSSAGYNFLRKMNMLPLPTPKTIRNYLRLIDTKCGFDQKFFELFKKKMNQKQDRQRHGVLLIDEIQLRESVAVDAKNLTYIGLTDFGDDYFEKKGKTIDEKATHGLVLMFQPLADTYTQPIAVFASKGPVDGTSLSQIILKAIVLLEKAGAYVHGFVSDGAQTNRKVWTVLGVSGRRHNFKNYFEHPLDQNRKIFVFSDTPHLIKCIRNRLYQEGTLRLSPDNDVIKWEHFQVLHNEDIKLPANLRVCPKITANHVNVSNVAKMKVKLAAQIFSESVATGLRFYSSHGVKGLENCHETSEFCLTINKMFDALNRKLPSEGLSPSSDDYMVLLESIAWLDKWEDNFEMGLIDSKEFLSRSTADGLRVTLHSTIDLSNYLINEFNFSYVLTGKINQDSLEKFFGIIRQAGGQNDHPATPTFLQLYKLLSVYGILKPPKYGNCSVKEEPKPLVSINEMKELYNKEKHKQDALEKLKEKLNQAIETAEWELPEIIEPDTSFANIADCVIYYATGYLCKQIQKHTKCDTCLASVATTQQYSRQPEAQLTNMKTHGGLIHPNLHFFNIILKTEEAFSQFCTVADVFDKVVDSVLENIEFTFPCNEHKEEILTYAITYYLRMRMRQFTREHNREKPKESSEKKKKAKFYKN